MKFPTYEEMAKDVAEKAMNEYEVNGKTLKEWIDLVIEYEQLKKEKKLFITPFKIGEIILVSIDKLPFFEIEDSEKLKKSHDFLPARVVSYRKNSKTTFIKIAVRAKWLSEWLDYETGPECDYIEQERYFSFPVSEIGKTILRKDD